MTTAFRLELVLILGCWRPSQFSALVINVVELSSISNHTFVYNVSTSTNLTRWTHLVESTATSLMSYQNGICTATPSNNFLGDGRYSYSCNSTAHYVTLHLTGGNLGLNNRIISCRDAWQPNGAGITWMIKIIQDNSCSYCEPTMTFGVKDISEGDNVTFLCVVPSVVPYVTWNRNIGSNTVPMGVQNEKCTTQGTTFLDDTSKYIYTCNDTVYRVTILNVQRSEHNDIYMCTPHGQTEGSGSNWIIKVEKAQVTSVTITSLGYLVNVTENTPREFTCTTSTATPAAIIYWYRHPNGQDSQETQITTNVTTTTDYNDLSVTSSILRLFVTRQDNDTNVFCTANNPVNTTEMRSTSKRILNVLYKADDPYIPKEKEYQVIENAQGTLACTVKGGNPTPTLTWECNGVSLTNKATVNSNRTITTLVWTPLRTHDGTCTCTSKQTGFQDTTVDVTLHVLYAANVTKVTINDLTIQSTTVNEGEQVRFICIADSNPTAVMSLSNEIKTLKNVTSKSVKYNISHASCSDTGRYYCSATNEYISKNVFIQTVQLLVNCAPRAAAELNTDIISAKNASKTITANVIAYPLPKFLWSQLMDGRWVPLGNNNKFAISSSYVQSNLTIRSVSKSDFTKYQVIVQNEFGQMEQNFTLSPYVVPETPTELRHIQSHTTTSSIHIEWGPGYNGGPTQTFYIKYKKSSDAKWTYFTVIDSGDETMDISLNGLVENTQYDIVIFASNIIGNSSESQVLVASTEATSINLGPLIGGIAGGVIVCIIIVIVIIVIIRRYKFSDGIEDNSMDMSLSPVARPASPSSDVKNEPVKPDINDDSVNGYEIVDVTTENKKRSDMKKPPQGKAATNASKMSNTNQVGLNYADLVSKDSQPVEKKELKVYEPTPYDIVDFTKKAEPLSDNDDDDKK